MQEAAVSCSPVVRWAGFGSGTMGKLGRAWYRCMGGAWSGGGAWGLGLRFGSG